VTGRVLAVARENGLILIRAGSLGNVVRVYAPLTIGPDDLARGLEILTGAVRQACAEPIAT